MDDALDPYSPKALYLVGHHATLVGGYFQQVLLWGKLAQHPDDRIAAYRDRWFKALKEELSQVSGLVVMADTLAKAHGLTLPTAPRTPEEWDPWRMAIFNGLRERVDLRDPHNAAFPFGWEHGLARATLVGLISLCELSAQGLDRVGSIEAGLHDLVSVAARWEAVVHVFGAAKPPRELLLTFGVVHRALNLMSKAQVRAGDAESIEGIKGQAIRVSRALRELEGVAWRTLDPTKGSAPPPRAR